MQRLDEGAVAARTGALSQLYLSAGDALRIALSAAGDFAGATAPNPPVGCVVLDERGAFLACGAHARAGAPHAEAEAIAACIAKGVQDRIHTFVVTLEPCNHSGKTPPCVEAILATPARAVWIGAGDPNPHVAGGGAARLAAAGLDVRLIESLAAPDCAELARAARRLTAPFARWSQTGRPWVAVKQALTAGGSMIPPAGRSTFTSESSLDLAHRLRRRADAIITGSGSILADAPAFTVRRAPDHAGKRRILAILDRRRRVPASYQLDAEARGFDVWVRDDLAALPSELGAAGAMEALVEAGPALTRAVLGRRLWDEHVVIRQRVGGADEIDVQTRKPV